MPGDGDHPIQEESKQEDEGEKLTQSKPEDSAPQEPAAGEGVAASFESTEPIQASASETPVTSEELAQKESGDDKPAENIDNTEERTVENGTSDGGNDGEKQEEGGGESVLQDADGSKDDQKPSEEQQGEVKPESEEAQKAAGDEQEEGGTPSASQVEQQEVPSQEEGNKPAQGEQEADKPAAESENHETPEKQESVELTGEKSEDIQGDGDAAKESPAPVENSPESENHSAQEESQGEAAVKDNEIVAEGQKSDGNDDGVEKPEKKPEEGDNAQENQTVEDTSAAESEPTTNKQEQSAEEVDKPANQAQSEATSTVQPGVATVQVVTVPADEAATPNKPDELQDENKKLKQDIFMMKQQEDAYRIKVLSLEQEVGKLRARKIDNRSQGE